MYPNSDMFYVNKGTSISPRNNIHFMHDVYKFREDLRIQKAPQLLQETILTLCRTYPNYEMVYVNKGTSTSAGNNIHLMQDVSKFRDILRKQMHLNFWGKNIHLMPDVSKFRDGLRKQRHLIFRRKQYSPYAGRIQIPRWST